MIKPAASLLNGVPLNVHNEMYEFVSLPPTRTGDEALIAVPSRTRPVRVVLLRGTGRKRWLVESRTLRKYLRADADRRMREVGEALVRANKP